MAPVVHVQAKSFSSAVLPDFPDIFNPDNWGKLSLKAQMALLFPPQGELAQAQSAGADAGAAVAVGMRGGGDLGRRGGIGRRPAAHLVWQGGGEVPLQVSGM